ncbi:glycosyltransferase family 1 protein [Microbacterium sp. MPKO10]|uniref:glycosyltransferase family 1 protein n=1 Tax=Microbacterium sp. MPKO10 TaxID=2989818 RepID=UPI0022369B2F|nr:glycosyltransferase family 1 protein [Microbacterium sp. MPKO10]MCW4457813.1 glycosyltransferase family 1 protein [Microbacterium sp. MPKO10]
MPGKKRILVLTYTPIKSAPRALKQINKFVEDYDVTTAGFGESPHPDVVEHIEFKQPALRRGLPGLWDRFIYPFTLLTRLYTLTYRTAPRNKMAAKALKGREWDLIITHDVATTPLAMSLPSTHGVIVDLHEYAPRQNEHSRLWRFLIAPYFRWILRAHVAHAAGVGTVSQGIVDEYSRNFDFVPELITNATPYQDLPIGEVSQTIKLVHSGIAAPARKLEVMIEAVRDADADVTLDLYLMHKIPEYSDKLRALAQGSDRIRFMDPVPYSELVQTLNNYDVGVSIIAPTTFNLAWCLPNKFFDYIQARLGIIIGPSPEMMRILDEHKLGAVAGGFEVAEFKRTLESMTVDDVKLWKRNSDANAQKLSGEEQVAIWQQMVRRILEDDR